MSAFASEVQYDKSVAEAAAKKAAEKVGDIRPSIDYDQVPGITKSEDIKPQSSSGFDSKKYENTTNDSQRITSIDRLEDSLDEANIDYSLTGSIKRTPQKRKIRVVWQKFDADGNLVQ